MASVDKVFHLIEVMTERAEPFGLTELARAAGLDKGTTHRLLESLIGHGYVTRTADSLYELTLKLWTLGARTVGRRSVVAQVPPFLKKLATLTGETVYLTIVDNLEAVYMARIDSPHYLRPHTPIGGRVPLYCGSTGKALLAYLSDQEIKRVGRSLIAVTPRTITRYDVLLKELARIRAKGYATSVGEWDLSISGVAAPVFGSDGNVVASIGVTGPVDRLNETSLTKLGPQVAGVAWELSEQVGCPPSSRLRAQ